MKNSLERGNTTAYFYYIAGTEANSLIFYLSTLTTELFDERGISFSAWQLSEYSLLSLLIFLQALKNITIHYTANETFSNEKKKY